MTEAGINTQIGRIVEKAFSKQKASDLFGALTVEELQQSGTSLSPEKIDHLIKSLQRRVQAIETMIGTGGVGDADFQSILQRGIVPIYMLDDPDLSRAVIAGIEAVAQKAGYNKELHAEMPTPQSCQVLTRFDALNPKKVSQIILAKPLQTTEITGHNPDEKWGMAAVRSIDKGELGAFGLAYVKSDAVK